MARKAKLWSRGKPAAQPAAKPATADATAKPIVIDLQKCTGCGVLVDGAELVGSCSHYGLVCRDCDVKERTAKFGSAHAGPPPVAPPADAPVRADPTADTLASMEALAAAAGRVLPAGMREYADGFGRGISMVKKLMQKGRRT
jgi:hypothetical protein